MRRLSRAAALTLLLSLPGCAPGADLRPLPDYQTASYRLGGGDQIRIITFGVTELTNDFRVDDRGMISLPLVGRIKASNLTPAQLETQIADALKKGDVLKTPSVSVEILSYRPIFVLGEVTRAGQYAFQPGMTMLTAVAVAGGFTYRAVQEYASDVRTTGIDTASEGLITTKSFIAPGDVIKVYERHF